jgi:hypothetical protein
MHAHGTRGAWATWYASAMTTAKARTTSLEDARKVAWLARSNEGEIESLQLFTAPLLHRRSHDRDVVDRASLNDVLLVDTSPWRIWDFHHEDAAPNV